MKFFFENETVRQRNHMLGEIGIALVIAILIRLWWILPGGLVKKKKKKRVFRSQVVAMAVLGSGKCSKNRCRRRKRRRVQIHRWTHIRVAEFDQAFGS